MPAGCYKVAYVNGAMKVSTNPWHLSYSGWNVWNCRILYNDGAANTTLDKDQQNNDYQTQADCEAGMAGAKAIFYHTGGKIGIQNFDDPTTDNTSGSPDPTFQLFKEV